MCRSGPCCTLSGQAEDMVITVRSTEYSTNMSVSNRVCNITLLKNDTGKEPCTIQHQTLPGLATEGARGVLHSCRSLRSRLALALRTECVLYNTVCIMY